MSIDGESEHLSNADLDVEMRTSEVAAGPGGGQTSCRIMLWSSKSNYGRLESLIIDKSERPTRCSTVLYSACISSGFVKCFTVNRSKTATRRKKSF